MERIKVGVLGASGLVGQRIVSLLVDHPWFQVAALSGERAVGRPYGDVWDGLVPLPPELAALHVGPTEPGAFAGCAVVFSALPADAARQAEPAFAEAGLGVVSNASAFRMEADVPLVIPEVNGDHLALIARQRRERGWRGFLVTNPNCSTIHLTLALAPLHRAFGLATVQVVTLQALSGAGRHGIAALDVIDNVIPYIGGEEDKLEHEPQKLLGTLTEAGIAPAPFVVSAQCTRVPTTHGHLEMVAVQLQQPASLEAIRATWEDWRPLADRALPHAPAQPVIVRAEPNRPQPRLDRDAAGGMASVVGRLRPDPIFDYRFAVLGHNLIRGAAGGVVLIAELLHAEGLIA